MRIGEFGSIPSAPVLEVFRGIYHATTAVGTTALAIPATNLSGRKAIIIQNLDTAKSVYVGGCIPEVIGLKLKSQYPYNAALKSGVWFPSAVANNEWFFATSSKGDPGLTTPTRLYTAAVGGAETLRTNGTVYALAAEHGWGWGGTAGADALGFNTLYIKTDGAAATNSPTYKYESVISYFNMPDTSSTYGYLLGPLDAFSMTVDGSVRIFAIASSASANVLTLEIC